MIGVLRGGSPSFRYVEEILSHAGLEWTALPAAESIAGGETTALVISGAAWFGEVDQNALNAYVQKGGVLLMSGGTAGLESLTGARQLSLLREGYLEVDGVHPLTQGLTSSLHVFGGWLLEATGGEPIGRVLDGQRQPTDSPALVINRVGQGLVITTAADLPGSVLHIQLGHPVWGDGVPAPDGTAPIDDGILKCDDGVVLSWDQDRERIVPAQPVPDCPGKHPSYPDGDTPWFAQPIADELREMLLRAVAWGAAEVGQHLSALWYWPRGLEAVGLISHDSDLNIDASARTTLEVLSTLGVRSTWCMMIGPTWPDRFTRETYDLIKAAGHEVALHYNALALDGGTWGEEHLRAQLAWVQQEAGVERISSNKNHYTRWEGRLEFFRWLEKAGIECDQSKGPSKKGNVGYPHGSCQPWFPYDAQEDRFINVLEIPLQTQDLWLTAPYAIAGQIIAMARRHHGVAHFLYHQVHIHRQAGVQDALRQTVADGSAAGLEWWTSEQINRWERLRRSVRIKSEASSSGGLTLRITSPEPVLGAEIVVVLPAGRGFSTEETSSLEGRLGEFHGLPALFLRTDLDAGETLLRLASPAAPVRQ